VADEDPNVVAFVEDPLRRDGRAGFHAYDVLSATRRRSAPETEAQLPPDVPILREPFTADELRTQVAAMLDGDGKQPIH
jgi:hypothetical protein